MITRYFQVICDYCGHNINDYYKNPPSYQELKKDNIVIYNKKHFCNDECKRWWKKVTTGGCKFIKWQR